WRRHAPARRFHSREVSRKETLPHGLFASHLSDDIFITHIGLDGRLAYQEDDYPYYQRKNRDTSNPHIPLCGAHQTWNPGRDKDHKDANCTRDETQGRTQVEYPVRGKTSTSESFMVPVANDDH